MVQQSRRVVENYILYKIHTTLSPDKYFPDETEYSTRQDILERVKKIPKPQNLTQIDFEVRKLAAQCETRYKDAFPHVLEELRYVL